MFLFFKTTIDFNVIASPKGWWFEHVTGNTYDLRICPFGQVAIFGLIGILILQHFINIPRPLFRAVIGLSMILSLINLNALVYLIPVWVTSL